MRSSLCRTDFDNAPWLALEFFEPVSVTRVVIYNRGDNADHLLYHQRLKNVEVRVTDKLPTSGEKMFTEGELLGTFAGPGDRGQIITIDGNLNVTQERSWKRKPKIQTMTHSINNQITQ